MAYGVLYEFHRTSTNGADMLITISQKDYTGEVKKRALGRAPIIKRDNNGHIYGTSCELYAECLVDGEFSHLYTSDAYEYKVEVYKNNTLIWMGYVSPELYSEPDIAPPYDVQIIATDGLGELKNYNFQKRGVASILDHLDTLMDKTGIETSWNVVSGLRYINEDGVSSYDKDILSVKIDLDHEEGNSYYDVLQNLLSSLNANITQHNGKYLIFRETDFINKAENVGIEAFDAKGISTRLPVASFGTMKSHQWWPVGQLSTVIEPAKNKVVLQSENHYKENVLKFKAWEKSLAAEYDDTEEAYVLPVAAAAISQTIDFGGSQVDYRLGLRVRARNVGSSIEEQNLGLKIEMEGKTYSVGTKYWLIKGDGSGRRPMTSYRWYNEESTFEEDLPTPSEGDTAADAQDIDVVLPLYRNISGNVSRDFAWAKNIKITIFNPTGLNSIYVYGVSLVKYEQIKGYEAAVIINNAAREEDKDVQLTMTDAGYAPETGVFFMTGLPMQPSGATPITKWQVEDSAPSDYLSVMAFDYSRAIALPKMKYAGILNVPGSETLLPTLFLRDGTYYFPKAYSYDLYADEINVELLSISAADVSLSSVTISQTSTAAGTMGGATTGGATTGGGGAVSMPRDKEMSDTSDNAVENRVIKAYVDALAKRVETEEGVTETYKEWWANLKKYIKVQNGNVVIDSNLIVKGDTSSGGNGGGGGTTGGGGMTDEEKDAYALKEWVTNGFNPRITSSNKLDVSLIYGLGALATKDSLSYSDVGVTKSVITSLIGTTTYAPYNANGYLPLNGGTINGIFTITGGADRKIVLDNSDADTNWNLISFRQNGVEYGRLGTAADADLKWNGNTLIHSGNIGSQSVTSARKLVTSGGTNLVYSDSSSYFVAGLHDYSTYIDGKTIYLRYAASGIGMVMNSSGNVTIGASDLAGTSAKLYVDGSVYVGNKKVLDRVSNNLHIGEGIRGSFDTSVFGTNILFNTTSGNNAMMIAIGGNVLIGTTTDNSSGKLQIEGGVTLNGYMTSNSVSKIADLGNKGLVVATGPSRSSWGMAMWTEGNGKGFIQQQAFTDAATTYPLCINPFGGNVGIGTAFPDYQLEVSGDIASYSSSAVVRQVIVQNSEAKASLYVGTTGNRGVYDNTNVQWLIYTDGTKTYIPSKPLTIAGATTINSTLSVSGAVTMSNELFLGNNVGIYFKNTSGSNVLAMYVDPSNVLQIGYNNIDSVAFQKTVTMASTLSVKEGVTAHGQFLLYTTNDAYRLTMYEVDNIARLYNIDASGNSYGDMYIGSNSANAIVVKGGSYVGVGMVPSGDYKLEIYGALKSTSVTTSLVRSSGGLDIVANNSGKGSRLWLTTNAFRPWGDDAGLIDLGVSNIRWRGLYCGTGDFSGAVTMSSTLEVGGIVTCNSHHRVLGSASVSGNFQVAEKVTFSNGMEVTGTSIFGYVEAADILASRNIECTNLIASGDTSSGSDIRFKDIIENKTIKIEDIANAPLFTFKWNDRNDDGIHLGSSAQYWEAITPELVCGNDFKHLNYASLGVAMGISLAQKAMNHEERIKILEKENKALKEEIRRSRNGKVC